MALAVLELNDLGLLIRSASGALYGEPGFARLNEQGIETGEPARAAAWLQPQASYNQYWRQLNQTPLPARQAWARHHADIAFAQLKQLHQQADCPDQLLIAVPGSFSDAQLSLLLGLASALPVEVAGLIDSGLAACLYNPQDTLLVDMQLHQSVLTLCRYQQGQLAVSRQELIPDVGLQTLYSSVAQYISRRLIEDFRYDPLHSSSAEQAIYDQLPGWLQQLASQQELAVTLPSPQGELVLVLRKQAVASLLSARLEHVLAMLKQWRAGGDDIAVHCSHRSALLPAYVSELSTATVDAQECVLTNVLRSAEAIIKQSRPIHCLKSLPVDRAEVEPGNDATGAVASHLLYQNRAWPLNQPLSLTLNGAGLELTGGIDYQASLIVVREQQQLKVLHQQPAVELQLPAQCVAGESLQLGSHRLQLIEVPHGN